MLCRNRPLCLPRVKPNRIILNAKRIDTAKIRQPALLDLGGFKPDNQYNPRIKNIILYRSCLDVILHVLPAHGKKNQ